jgi:hypothetical protein
MGEVRIPVASIKGRGAASSVAHRFSCDVRVAFDGCWGTLDTSIDADAPGPVATLVTPTLVGKAISRNQSPDIYFEYGLNPYRGCELHYPQRAARVMARIRDMRGGRDYDADFSSRMKGSGVWAQLLAQRFTKACARLGLNRERRELDLSLFRPSALSPQSELF